MNLHLDPSSLVKKALEKWHGLAAENGWELNVQWSGSSVQYGCKLCMRSVATGEIQLSHRHRSKDRSKCFAHGNIICDLKRSISTHHKCKSHQIAKSKAANLIWASII